MPEHPFLQCGDVNLFGVRTIFLCLSFSLHYSLCRWEEGGGKFSAFVLQQMSHSSHLKCCYLLRTLLRMHQSLFGNSTYRENWKISLCCPKLIWVIKKYSWISPCFWSLFRKKVVKGMWGIWFHFCFLFSLSEKGEKKIKDIVSFNLWPILILAS